MDLHVCIKIDDDAVNKIARVITETVKRVTEIQQTGAGQQAAVPQSQTEGITPAALQATAYSAQIAQATQIPVQAMTGQPVQTTATPPQSTAPQPTPVQTPVQQSVPATPQSAALVQQTAVPTAARTYTQDELAGAAMVLMDRGMQAQLQDLLAGFGVEALPMLPPEQYGNFATALRGMGAQI